MNDKPLTPDEISSLLGDSDSEDEEINVNTGGKQSTDKPAGEPTAPEPPKAERSMSQSEIDALLKSMGMG